MIVGKEDETSLHSMNPNYPYLCCLDVVSSKQNDPEEEGQVKKGSKARELESNPRYTHLESS